uniref:Ribonuclease P protein component n=1 Tax=Candidatus Kentrum sp. UNK TaxID=2126344 RepID=A0A451B2Q0_9GAMM|nr:MAG: ribonuclease P protein component [Candidatus Kentron sp. UNK]VFK72564.1 MAG: ribonuclease P protein component [Candidatus Kentron sp. UNK]
MNPISAPSPERPVSNGFPRSLRLRHKRDYARVFQDPRRSVDSVAVVLGRRNEEGLPRLGLAIPKRKVRLAVARNRAKRLIRESFRAHQRLLQGLDVVIIGRSAMGSIESADFFLSLERHWKKIRNRCDAP